MQKNLQIYIMWSLIYIKKQYTMIEKCSYNLLPDMKVEFKKQFQFQQPTEHDCESLRKNNKYISISFL